MNDWVWVETRVVVSAHDEQLAEHGGLDGIRDRGALESALTRPKNLAAYETPDAAALAAAYAFGIARNHPFADGNKRTALVVLETFLNLNGFVLDADDVQCVLTILELAAGSLSENGLAHWIRGNMAPQT